MTNYKLKNQKNKPPAKKTALSPAQCQALQHHLLQWFEVAKRDLPWRQERSPYHTLLSEIMLQQTQVATVIPFYQKFLFKWPTLQALASATEKEILKAWEGLGYYRRARYLQRAAQYIDQEAQGVIPQTLLELEKIPGIGAYTAGAIRSLAYNLPAAAIDGNILRVFSRFFMKAWQIQTAADQKEMTSLILNLQENISPRTFNESLMDFGQAICTAKNPSCSLCCLNFSCLAFQHHCVDLYPIKKIKVPKKTQHLTYLIFNLEGKIYAQKRTANLLFNLYEFFLIEAALSSTLDVVKSLPAPLKPFLQKVIFLGHKKHVFTHLIWDFNVFEISLDQNLDVAFFFHQLKILNPDCQDQHLFSLEQLAELPFSTALVAFRNKCLLTEEI